MKLFFTFLILVTLADSGYSQVATDRGNEDNADDPYEHQSYFMYGVNCLSDNVYLGRKDSVALPYISPYAGYHFSNGIYGKALASYAPSLGRLDLLTLEAGWDHSFGDHINAGINGDKFFYSKNSNSIRSSTSGGAGVYGQFSNDWIEPQVSWDINFNKGSTDYVAGIMLDHDFGLENNALHFIPVVGMNAGTQHYYDEYFVNKLTKKDKTVKVKKVIANASKFVPLDYEISTKVTYRVRKWLFTISPVYSIPTSPATIALPKKKTTTVVTEKLTNSFFIELDICHR